MYLLFFNSKTPNGSTPQSFPILALQANKIYNHHKAVILVILADDLTPAQIKAFRLLANQSANWADWDEDLLKLELEDLQALNFDLELTGFDFDEIQKLLDANDIDLEEPAESSEVDPADNIPVISKLGDLWILGDHRLYCGDSTLIDSYKIVLEDEQADITLCDPPDHVNYGASIKDTKIRCATNPVQINIKFSMTISAKALKVFSKMSALT